MPNWCTNTVTMKDLVERVIKRNEKGEPVFDFNDILPMPEDLNVSAGSNNEQDIMLYLTENLTVPLESLSEDKKEILDEYVTNHFGGDSWHSTIWKRCEAIPAEDRERRMKDGEHLVNNIQKYGCMTWYEWCSSVWGTKWNACSTYVEDGEPDTVEFDTAWAPPAGVLEALSKKYPDDTLTCEWHEEGGTYGRFVLLNGQCIEHSEGEWTWDEEDEVDYIEEEVDEEHEEE